MSRFGERMVKAFKEPHRALTTVARRIQHLVNDGLDLPDLIIIDGGKGQLSRALEAARNFTGDVRVISIAKRLEEIYYDPERDPLALPKSSPALKIIQNMRDEAHRFAIAYHRKLRERKTTGSALDGISISAGTKKLLLERFRSIGRIREAGLEDLRSIPGIGEKTARTIYKFFH